jgi:hypothetical protein
VVMTMTVVAYLSVRRDCEACSASVAAIEMKFELSRRPPLDLRACRCAINLGSGRQMLLPCCCVTDISQLLAGRDLQVVC